MKDRKEKEREREGGREKGSALAFFHIRWRDVKFLDKLCWKEDPLIGISNSSRTGSSRKSYAEQVLRYWL